MHVEWLQICRSGYAEGCCSNIFEHGETTCIVNHGALGRTKPQVDDHNEPYVGQLPRRPLHCPVAQEVGCCGACACDKGADCSLGRVCKKSCMLKARDDLICSWHSDKQPRITGVQVCS